MRKIFRVSGVLLIVFSIYSCKKVQDPITREKLIKDGDGNIYTSVKIGTQVWITENLKATKYNDGTAIRNITDAATWAAATTGAYSDYGNLPANSTTYGRLYNWYVVDNNTATKMASNGGKSVCPTGWHVPSDAEWSKLMFYLGGYDVACVKLKETGTIHWGAQNTEATNETGFTALPGGSRDSQSGTYNSIGSNGFWWSSTERLTTNARGVWVSGYNTNVISTIYYKNCGQSVRCVMDF